MAGRGKLRVLLGAAPGVGKTFDMLGEGHRLRAEGIDVVIGVLETHGRAATQARAQGLPQVPRRVVAHRGVELSELDTAAVLARAPQVALVDELAHTNAPGGAEKRWQDVEELLAAGIDVISTVNVQHIASLNDVVENITGVRQLETVPDEFLRRADQIEVIDLAPSALQGRLADGLVYPAERIDAALSNYFRLGNLTALRELALLWLADEVDVALQHYRDEHGIEATWEARERVVVALTGGPEGETLLRRAARIVSRAGGGGDLLAVHVTGQDGLLSRHGSQLTEQRALVDTLGGTYHALVGEDVPTTLVTFARSMNATQLVLGASRRGRWQAALTGPGIGATVIRESGDIDVHIVNHADAGGRFRLPPLGGALSARRRLLGFVLALLGGPALTAVLQAVRTSESITSDVLSYMLLVVVVALVGGAWPALFAAVMSGLTLDFFFIEPLLTITIADPLHARAMVLYVVIAALVSFVVDRAARRSRAAQRSRAESELVQAVAGSVLRGQDAVAALTERAAEAFALDGVAVVRDDRVVAASDGRVRDTAPMIVPLTATARLQYWGGPISPADQRPFDVIVRQLTAALEHQELTETARTIEPIAASDRARGALLSALSHDLRRPLAAATAAVGGLRAAGASLSAADAAELLQTADESLAGLSTLVTDLLDVSRLQAGVLALASARIDPAEAIAPALDELALGPDDLALDLRHDGASVSADPVLLQRVVANLLANAVRFSPAGSRVRVATSTFGDRVEIRVIDHGPGVDEARREDIFLPFQRLGDTDNTTGLGLGLALSRGFIEAMGGRLVPETTPGGGLTMVVSLPRADEEEPA